MDIIIKKHNTMKDLFYSQTEQRLFWIAGYTDNSSLVTSIVLTLESCRNYFIKQCKLPQNAFIKTDYCTSSMRYKSMRYFWVDNIETPPEDAFVLGDDWTMDKWIKN